MSLFPNQNWLYAYCWGGAVPVEGGVDDGEVLLPCPVVERDDAPLLPVLEPEDDVLLCFFFL
jgi:hypothetical protein